MRLSDGEIRIILGAIDTQQCELSEQGFLDDRHEAELADLRELANKLVGELNKRAVPRAKQGEWSRHRAEKTKRKKTKRHD